ncbi:hypothetical protein GL4_1494 [Methyloceanibacter caenitepidi]|uniref:Uncharacterized protein n=2 Tax=Methyloceanibacter caenitepidi TaxID=1384459 RepID=A0A0A8K225_9HYPH|nr:hypothetical protein GL4_1494 [Methyloceanibacter caenitepidi]
MKGDTVEAGIAHASIELDMPFNSCWRAYQRRCGNVLFRALYEAEQDALARQEDEARPEKVIERLEKQEARTVEVAERLDRLERKIDAVYELLARIPGDPADCSRRPVCADRRRVRGPQPDVPSEGAVATPA